MQCVPFECIEVTSSEYWNIHYVHRRTGLLCLYTAAAPSPRRHLQPPRSLASPCRKNRVRNVTLSHNSTHASYMYCASFLSNTSSLRSCSLHQGCREEGPKGVCPGTSAGGRRARSEFIICPPCAIAGYIAFSRLHPLGITGRFFSGCSTKNGILKEKRGKCVKSLCFARGNVRQRNEKNVKASVRPTFKPPAAGGLHRFTRLGVWRSAHAQRHKEESLPETFRYVREYEERFDEVFICMMKYLDTLMFGCRIVHAENEKGEPARFPDFNVLCTPLVKTRAGRKRAGRRAGQVFLCSSSSRQPQRSAC